MGPYKRTQIAALDTYPGGAVDKAGRRIDSNSSSTAHLLRRPWGTQGAVEDNVSPYCK